LGQNEIAAVEPSMRDATTKGKTMRTNLKLEGLFAEWKEARNYAGFFHDGVIGEDDWKNVSPRIVFVLKENHSDGWRIDGPIDIRGGTNRQFFPNLARWKYLIDTIARTAGVPDYPSDAELQEHQGGWHLRNAAYVNIKKPKGRSKSSATDIMSYAKTDRGYLRREIDIVDPHIVVCGRTFWPYHAIYDGNNSIRQVTDRLHMHGNRVVIDFYHPGWWECPGGQRGLYGRLKTVLDNSRAIEAIAAACC